jgi:ATP-dependent DNA helicase RecQ
MLQQGLVEIAYDQGHALKLTEASKEVLFEGRKVEFVRQQRYQRQEEAEPRFRQKKTKKQILEEELFADLRVFRQALAQERGVPPHVIFPDPTLKEMAEKRPIIQKEFIEISGVTQRKQSELGEAFIKRIMQFIARKTVEGERVPNGSQIYSWMLYDSGKSIDQICAARSLKVDTVYAHFSKADSLGLEVNLEDFVSKQEQEDILLAIEKLGQEAFKPVFEFFKGKYPFGLLRLVADLG